MLCKVLENIPFRLGTENYIGCYTLESKSYHSISSVILTLEFKLSSQSYCQELFHCEVGNQHILNFPRRVTVESYFIVRWEINTKLHPIPDVALLPGGARASVINSSARHIIGLMTAWQRERASESGREGHRMSCMSFSVFNSSQPVTMETVSWGELKTKNAVQIQVAAGVRLSRRRSAAWGGGTRTGKKPGIVGKFTPNQSFYVSCEYVVCGLCCTSAESRRELWCERCWKL